MILGHEVAATVEEVGVAVTRVKPGDWVAVSPSLPCKTYKYCLMGRQNQCLSDISRPLSNVDLRQDTQS
jgi:L-idonate 5-dehydrogenase